MWLCVCVCVCVCVCWCAYARGANLRTGIYPAVLFSPPHADGHARTQACARAHTRTRTRLRVRARAPCLPRPARGTQHRSCHALASVAARSAAARTNRPDLRWALCCSCACSDSPPRTPAVLTPLSWFTGTIAKSIVRFWFSEEPHFSFYFFLVRASKSCRGAVSLERRRKCFGAEHKGRCKDQRAVAAGRAGACYPVPACDSDAAAC